MDYHLNILFTGNGRSGSWQCRGVQLGGQVGTAKRNANHKDMKSYDAVVVVKRLNSQMLNEIRKSGKLWIWDVVDFYPQPTCGLWSKDEAVSWVRREIENAKPDGIIWPNQKMQDDVLMDGVVIYHHARLAPVNPIREHVKTVGYDGSIKFLGRWRGWIESECRRRGWYFVERVPLDKMDIVVAFRDGENNGYVQQNWKSNVKLANAHATGTPFVGHPEEGYLETWTGKECWVSNKKSLADSFDFLGDVNIRRGISDIFLANTYTLESRANQLRRYVETLLRNR